MTRERDQDLVDAQKACNIAREVLPIDASPVELYLRASDELNALRKERTNQGDWIRELYARPRGPYWHGLAPVAVWGAKGPYPWEKTPCTALVKEGPKALLIIDVTRNL